MRRAGFNYNHPDEVEDDIRERLAALTNGGRIPVEKMSPEQLAALKNLQDYERRVAVMNFKMAKEVFDPVEEKITREMYPRKVQ
jgi:hypothetical protein